MKILTLSDLNWLINLKEIKDDDIGNIREENLNDDRYIGIKLYLNIINDEQPDLVLFAGDITGDGSCGHGYQNAMKILLNILELKKTHSFLISGDHDTIENYAELVAHTITLKYAQDISNQFIEHKGIKLLGISFRKQKIKKELKELINSQEIDIILSHMELKRRIWLFDFNTKFIITGHFDRKLVPIENKVFISLNNDIQTISYCVLKKLNKTSNWDINYKILEPKDGKLKTISVTENYNDLLLNKRNSHFKYDGEQRSFSPLKDVFNYYKKTKPKTEREINKMQENFQLSLYGMGYLRGQNYKIGIERIRKIKKEKQFLTKDEESGLLNLEICNIMAGYKISKIMIVDYIGKNYLKSF